MCVSLQNVKEIWMKLDFSEKVAQIKVKITKLKNPKRLHNPDDCPTTAKNCQIKYLFTLQFTINGKRWQQQKISVKAA